MIVIQKSNGYFNMGTNLKNIVSFSFPSYNSWFFNGYITAPQVTGFWAIEKLEPFGWEFSTQKRNFMVFDTNGQIKS